MEEEEEVEVVIGLLDKVLQDEDVFYTGVYDLESPLTPESPFKVGNTL